EAAPFRMDIRPPDSWRPRSSPPELHRMLPVRRQDESAPIARREMQMSPPLLPSVGVPSARAFRVLRLVSLRTFDSGAGGRLFLTVASTALRSVIAFAHRPGILFAPHIKCRLGHVQNARADAFGISRVVVAVDVLID